DNRYAQIEDDGIKNDLQLWLHEAWRYVPVRGSNKVKLVPFESNPTTVSQALESIRTHTYLPVTVRASSWLDGRRTPPADEILPCRTVNVHIPTRCVLPTTPALFTSSALDFDFDPAAPEPTSWLLFLQQLWRDDQEQIDLLQEWFGYLLTPD